MREIEGVTQLNRKKYFSVSDTGFSLEKNLRSEDRIRRLTLDLGVKFGRLKDPLKDAANWRAAIAEDPKKPGHADLELLQSKLSKTHPSTPRTLSLQGKNLNLVAEDSHKVYPKFMGAYQSSSNSAPPIPRNIDAYAEMISAVLLHGYNDFTRPGFYQPMKASHWSYSNDKHFADWHLKTRQEIKKNTPDVKVGGHCMPVPYFYQDQYRSWNGMRNFIDNTEGKLDFYSFVGNDYYCNAESGFNESRVTSGLPLEGVIDLFNNYFQLKFHRNAQLLISEHGGAILSNGSNQDYMGEFIARDIFDKLPKELKRDGFIGELQRRSISQWIHLSSIIANTLTFFEHPHTIQKAVPHITLDSSRWSPRHYAGLYTTWDYDPEKELKESFLMNFFNLMRDIEGHRVIADCPDSDLQVRSFVDGNTTFTIINNLSTKRHKVSLRGLKNASHKIRRLTRGPHLLPSYEETKLLSTIGLHVESRECLVIVSTFPDAIKTESTLNERAFYGHQVTYQISENHPSGIFQIRVPDHGKAIDALLRVSFDRVTQAGYDINITFNGEPLEAPVEDSAERFHEIKTGYATTRFVPIPSGLLRANNSVVITFPDGKTGTVGATVIRARFPKQPGNGK